jgi:hypothetical protein
MAFAGVDPDCLIRVIDLILRWLHNDKECSDAPAFESKGWCFEKRTKPT